MSFTVTYDGNGATAGTPPVDPNKYNAGDTVTVFTPTSSFVRNSDFFARWNTTADGTGTPYSPNDTFTMPASNVTLFAQWYTNTGLINGGQTAHYTIWYESGLASQNIEPARTNQILSVPGPGQLSLIESDYQLMTQTWFGGVDLSTVLQVPLITYVDDLGGGAGWGPPLNLRPGAGDYNYLRYLIVSEVSEMCMYAQNQGWFAPDGSNEQSCGEALSRFLGYQLLQSIGVAFPDGYQEAPYWLNSSLPPGTAGSSQLGGNITTLTSAVDATATTLRVKSAGVTPFDPTYLIQVDNETMLVASVNISQDELTVTRGQNGTTAASHAANAPVYFNYGPRADYVNVTLEYDHGLDPAVGCSLLFLYYLNVQLGFQPNEIIAAAPGVSNASTCLRGVYTNLTGDTNDPFPFFSSLLANAFPPDEQSSIPGPNPDNPFPLGSLTVWGLKDTWGQNEVNDIVTNSGGTYQGAFWLMLQGFSQRTVGNILPTIPTINFTDVTALLDPNSAIYETTNDKIPQNIRFGYDVHFTSGTVTAFPATGETPAALTSAIKILGTSFPALADFFFIGGPNPYFVNVLQLPNPADENAPWLSTDLRVFQTCPGANGAGYQPVPGTNAPTFDTDSESAAYQYITDLIPWLNSKYGNPGSTDPFLANSGVVPDQQTQTNSDGSVTPYTNVNGSQYNNYNFALARVRLRGTPGPSGAATGVKVFFRIWGTQTADTNWDPSYTYLSEPDSAGLPGWPVAPSDNHTIPFFASQNPNFGQPNDPEFGPNGVGVNNQTIEIQSGNYQDTQWAYFGCFLNVYSNTLTVNGVIIKQAFPGNHHCLVAQIAYDGAPIENIGNVITSPENSTQLAQRNLQITPSDNPGPAAAHRVPQTFDTFFTPQKEIIQPDVFMIDWGDVPTGSVAHIYWPQTTAQEIISLATSLFGSHNLSQDDTNTIRVQPVQGGASYIPIPFGEGEGLAGLLYIDLPPRAVRRGDEYNVLVRRLRIRSIFQQRDVQTPQVAPRNPSSSTSVFGSKSVVPVKRLKAQQTAIQPSRPAYMRSVIGSFNVRIPVATATEILPGEEDLLAILKARFQLLSNSNRWYPVLQRYIGYVSGRVDGLGASASSIPPSFGGAPVTSGQPIWCEGKVCAIAFDKFGEFDGFVMNVLRCDICEQGGPCLECHKGYGKWRRRFYSRGSGMKGILEKACVEGWLVSVKAFQKNPDVVEEVLLHPKRDE